MGRTGTFDHRNASCILGKDHLKKMNPRDYLAPEVAAKLDRFELRARLIVEGFITGLHKSPYHGFSVEFLEHREYLPGDSIKHID